MFKKYLNRITFVKKMTHGRHLLYFNTLYRNAWQNYAIGLNFCWVVYIVSFIRFVKAQSSIKI